MAPYTNPSPHSEQWPEGPLQRTSGAKGRFQQLLIGAFERWKKESSRHPDPGVHGTARAPGHFWEFTQGVSVGFEGYEQPAGGLKRLRPADVEWVKRDSRMWIHGRTNFETPPDLLDSLGCRISLEGSLRFPHPCECNIVYFGFAVNPAESNRVR